MILTKSKVLAAALVACGVAASGRGSLRAAGARPATRPTGSAAVEQKLDRLIKILENQNCYGPRRWPADLADRPSSPRRRRGIPRPAQPPAPPAPPAAPGQAGMIG